MPTIKLTEKAIARIPAPDPSGKQVLYWDQELKGFGVLASGVSNAKTYIVQRALPDGRTRRVTIARTNVLKLEEAITKAKLTLAEFYSGKDPKARLRENPTLKSVLEDYLEARSDLKERSADYYEDTVNRHLASWLDTPLRNIGREMVEERLRKIAQEVSAANTKKDSDDAPGEIKRTGNATANGAMRAFRVLYNFAADRAPAENPMPPNPVRLKKQWLKVKPRTRIVPADSMKKFYEATCALENKVARDYILLILFTGLRRREASRLRWEHVDFTQRVLSIPSEHTKADRALDLPMSDFVHDLLVARRSIGDAKWVFPAASKSGHIEEPKSHLREITKASRIEVSVHDLRRTYITIAESTDMSVLALKALVNHSLGNDVTEGYVQMNVERLREPAQRVCDKLKALCEISPSEGANVARLGRSKRT